MGKRSIIGVDLGGTKGAIARYDADTLVQEAAERIPTSTDGFLSVLDAIAATVQTMKTPDTVAVGVGVPGLVRQPEGILLHAPNIDGSVDIPVRELLEQKLGLPVRIDNDANCFALAEALRGGGRGHRVVCGITFGTGVGGGIVINGELFRGSHGYSAEVGHMLLMPGNPPYDTDDKRGSVEQFLSGTAMGKRCVQAKRPQDYLEGEVCSFLQPHIFREVAWLCTSLTYLLDPDIFVFGGSAGLAFKPHLEKIEAELRRWTLPTTPLPQLAVAELKDAGMMGAALLAI